MTDEKTKTTETQPSNTYSHRMAFTIQETAELLGVCANTVRNLLTRKLLKCSQALRHKMIPKTEIERFLRDTL